MKKLSGDIIYGDCDFEAKGETIGEVKSKMMDHAFKFHKDQMNHMSIEQIHHMEDKIERLTEDDYISPV